MPKADQGISRGRYMVIPRAVIFLRRGEFYLLIKGAPTKRLWAGKYNGIGGHVERGEDVASAARRELQEETGLEADLWLCGTLMVDAGEIGVCVYVFSGEALPGEPVPSAEGAAEWVAYERVVSLPVVEDVPAILSKVHGMRRGDPPFAARSFYDAQGKLRLEFSA